MTAARARSGRRKKAKALGSVITKQLHHLRVLADKLNGSPHFEPLPGDPDPEGSRRNVEAAAALAGMATDVIEPTLRVRYPKIPDEAAERFNTLAAGAPIRYVVGHWPFSDRPPSEQWFFTPSGGSYMVHLRAESAEAAWVVDLAWFLGNPQRDRLHRCPKCQRWFVDTTRNKAALRCSRKCTIAYSNAQRSSTKRKRDPND